MLRRWESDTKRKKGFKGDVPCIHSNETHQSVNDFQVAVYSY